MEGFEEKSAFNRNVFKTNYRRLMPKFGVVRMSREKAGEQSMRVNLSQGRHW